MIDTGKLLRGLDEIESAASDLVHIGVPAGYVDLIVQIHAACVQIRTACGLPEYDDNADDGQLSLWTRDELSQPPSQSPSESC
jgi:hypothetical protein